MIAYHLARVDLSIEEERMRTWKELAKEALDVQMASNLSGCVHSFSRAITEIRELLRTEGKESTENVNRHPICILFSSKIASLTYSDSGLEFGRAWEWCESKANEKVG